jgi:hypothetical protein
MMTTFIPNSFQTPNAYVDQFMHLLSGPEYKVLCYLVRRIFGFQKRQDRVSMRQITSGIRNREGDFLDHGTGLSVAGAHTALQGLIENGLVRKVATNNINNEGILYELQLDPSRVNVAGLEQRASHQQDIARLRTSKARGMKEDNAILSHRTPPVEEEAFCPTEHLPSVPQKKGVLSDSTPAFCPTETQKTEEIHIEIKKDNQIAEIPPRVITGADAPAPTRAQQDPVIALFFNVTGRFPSKDQIPIVIQRWKDHQYSEEDLKPFWNEWVARDYRRTSLGWLDWVEAGCVPHPWGKKAPSPIDLYSFASHMPIEGQDKPNEIDPKACELWQKILTVLSQDPGIKKVDFDTWINSAVPLKLENNCLLVGSANKIGCTWLEKNLTPSLVDTLAQLTWEPTSVQFQVNPCL